MYTRILYQYRLSRGSDLRGSNIFVSGLAAGPTNHRWVTYLKAGIPLAAAAARKARLNKLHSESDSGHPEFTTVSSDEEGPPPLKDISNSEDEEGDWDGTVNHWLSSDSEFCWTDTDASEDSDGFELLEGEALHASLDAELQRELENLTRVRVDLPIMHTAKNMSKREWKKGEAKLRTGVHTGTSKRTQERHDHNARVKAAEDAKTRKSASADFMRKFAVSGLKRAKSAASAAATSITATASPSGSVELPASLSMQSDSATGGGGDDGAIFRGYLSDYEVEDEDLEGFLGGDEFDDDDDEATPQALTANPCSASESFDKLGTASYSSTAPDTSTADNEWETDMDSPGEHSFRITNPPPRKRRRLEEPVRETREKAKQKREEERKGALKDISKLVRSKRSDTFDGGASGLQASRARAIESLLTMMLKFGRGFVDASERAAESRGLSKNNGARMLRGWTKVWIAKRELPKSRRGKHSKSFSLLDDPAIRAELRSFVRSNKWAMDPSKVAQFSKDTLITNEAKKYLQHAVDEEMPRGLKRYMEVELFPQIHMKVGKGISLSTARRWLRKEGFSFTEYKKGLYFDGHERPDVVSYRQDEFLPAMEGHSGRLVEYEVGNVEKEVEKDRKGERKLVLVAHDEMTAQAHDGKKKSWVLDGEQPLRKKGVGRGIHQSDVIASTCGWIKEASQTLEYGKNYEGYWTGELFVKQLRDKIIPAFEKIHPPSEYQALIMVDNSQGHSAYGEDALVVSRMNMRPGGKQPRLRKTWFVDATGQRIEQEMVFPADHPKHPNLPKGMQQVLVERGLWRSGLLMTCKERCDAAAKLCCAKRILELQPDFKAQKSLVQEVIEEAGHLCIFLPKFHCELNFIEFFWGAVKRYLREHCDYTFDTLKTNMPLALTSVPLSTIRKWEHRMKRWMTAYRGGLDAKSAQFQVKKFTSRRYTSHRRVPETLGRAMDVD